MKFTKETVYRPDFAEIRAIVDRDRRIIYRNAGARKGAKIILLLPKGMRVRPYPAP